MRFLFIILAALTFQSCQNSMDGKKGHWTESQKKKYMEGCESSAKKAQEKSGQGLPEGYIPAVCACSLDKIAEQQDFDGRKDFSDEQAMEIARKVAMDCAKDFANKMQK